MDRNDLVHSNEGGEHFMNSNLLKHYYSILKQITRILGFLSGKSKSVCVATLNLLENLYGVLTGNSQSDGIALLAKIQILAIKLTGASSNLGVSLINKLIVIAGMLNSSSSTLHRSIGARLKLVANAPDQQYFQTTALMLGAKFKLVAGQMLNNLSITDDMISGRVLFILKGLLRVVSTTNEILFGSAARILSGEIMNRSSTLYSVVGALLIPLFGIGSEIGNTKTSCGGSIFPAFGMLSHEKSVSIGSIKLSGVSVVQIAGNGVSESTNSLIFATWRLPYFEDDVLIIENAIGAQMNQDVLEVT